ncbi:hypothetical protein DFH06DRAFT_1335565 [Mycena polygramma]|nr:hypothetical protein DFH06DRAFT_1335565 [Mycena polygramma]
MRKIPQELVDVVIDLSAEPLSEGDRFEGTLSELSLVCRTWLPATRRRLFSNVDLKRLGSVNDSNHHSKRTHRFLQMLDAEACTFTPYVTTLSMEGTEREAVEYHEPFRILSRLAALTSINFTCYSFDFDMEPIQMWLSSLRHLKELTLHRVFFPLTGTLLSSLESCRSLTSLTITSSTWESGYLKQISDMQKIFGLVLPQPRDILYSASRSILRLHLDCPKAKLLEAIITAAAPPSCNRVQLTKIEPDETQSIGAFLRYLGSTLQDLSLSFLPKCKAAEQFCRDIDLRANTGLRSLRIDDFIYHFSFHGPCPLTDLPSLLRQCVSPSLTSITFSISRVAIKHLLTFNWADLDASLLSSVDYHHTFRKINFLVPDLPLEEEQIRVGLLNVIQSLLPLAAACKLFEIVVLPGGLRSGLIGV